MLGDKQELIEIAFDSEGRFSKKLPLLNTSYALAILGNTTATTVLEPGQTYFFLSDYKTGQTLIMGDDARLQNELLTHDIPYISHGTHVFEGENKVSEERLMNFLAEGKQKLAKANAELDSLIAVHPNLSQRYINFARGGLKVEFGRDLMQARFITERFDLPKAYVDYVSKELWLQHCKPYTLHDGFSTFMRDYINVCSSSGKDQKVEVLALIKKMASCGDITLTEDELAAFDQFVIESEKLKQTIESTEDPEQKKALSTAFKKNEKADYASRVLIDRNTGEIKVFKVEKGQGFGQGIFMKYYTVDNEEEVKLFINTMIAAYRVAMQSPTLNIIEGNGDNTDKSFDAIPFDGNVSNNVTSYNVYFKAEDVNLISESQKNIHCKIYMGGGSEVINVDGEDINVTHKSGWATAGWKIFDTATNAEVAAVYDNQKKEFYYPITSGREYYLQVPLVEPGTNGNGVVNLSETKSLDIYIEVQSFITKNNKVNESALIYDNFKLTQLNLFDLD
mgnify:CR=1 FL=1